MPMHSHFCCHNFSNSFLKCTSVSSSKIQNSTVFKDVEGFSVRNFFDSYTRIFAHLSFGNPKVPELMAGFEMLTNPFCDSSKCEIRNDLFNLSYTSCSHIYDDM